ncbi:MAG: aldo/keto reductase [Halieaceae bacterium]|nr:aldo/keto reductase [Halieaceae bacterium]
MRYHSIGDLGIRSSLQALGCMGMSEFYGTATEKKSLAVLSRAVELGINHFDTADLYGRGANEILVGKFLRETSREDILIASKFGIMRDPDGVLGSTSDRELNNSPEYAKRACDNSLRRLGLDYIDLYYLHRYDSSIPIEDIVGTLGELVTEGKIRAIGLCEINAHLLRRACSEHPIAALQSEYSLFARDVENEILPTCLELGVSFLAYSPLGRGILSGRIKSVDTLEPNDLRRQAPMFSRKNLPHNLLLVEKIEKVAEKYDVTSAQIALAWLYHFGDNIIPIPGTKRIRYLEENVEAMKVTLSKEDFKQLEKFTAPENIAGGGKWSTRQDE